MFPSTVKCAAAKEMTMHLHIDDEYLKESEFSRIPINKYGWECEKILKIFLKMEFKASAG